MHAQFKQNEEECFCRHTVHAHSMLSLPLLILLHRPCLASSFSSHPHPTPPLSSSYSSFFSLSSYSFSLSIDHEWPPKWQDETEGYMASQLGREKEIMELTGSNERWENWMQYIQVIWFTFILVCLILSCLVFTLLYPTLFDCSIFCYYLTLSCLG